MVNSSPLVRIATCPARSPTVIRNASAIVAAPSAARACVTDSVTSVSIARSLLSRFAPSPWGLTVQARRACLDHTPRPNSLNQMRTGELGHWWRSLGGPPPPRPPLPGPASADVVVVGAGFTGLWTAYYLKRAQPSLEILVLEREHAGFGASGRNGGWVSGFFSGPARAYERQGQAHENAFTA